MSIERIINSLARFFSWLYYRHWERWELLTIAILLLLLLILKAHHNAKARRRREHDHSSMIGKKLTDHKQEQ